jgi:hypothetical protein
MQSRLPLRRVSHSQDAGNGMETHARDFAHTEYPHNDTYYIYKK